MPTVKETIVAALRHNGGEMSLEDIYTTTKLKQSTVRATLPLLVQSGDARRVRHGIYTVGATTEDETSEDEFYLVGVTMLVRASDTETAKNAVWRALASSLADKNDPVSDFKIDNVKAAEPEQLLIKLR